MLRAMLLLVALFVLAACASAPAPEDARAGVTSDHVGKPGEVK